MKNIVIIIFLFIFNMISYAENIVIPPYNKDISQACGCDCDQRIIYQQLPINENTLQTWVREAVVNSFSYGFGNYQSALKDASFYFTPNGWEKFTEALKRSGNLEKIVNDKLIISAEILSQPKIIEQKTEEQSPRWQVQLPIKVKYFNEKFSKEEKLQITLLLLKSPTIADIRGLGIEQLIAEPKP